MGVTFGHPCTEYSMQEIFLSHANQTNDQMSTKDLNKKLPANKRQDKNGCKRLQKLNAIKKTNHASATKLTQKRLHLLKPLL